MSLARQPSLDENMVWLRTEAPQFHQQHFEPQATVYTPVVDGDDGDSSSSYPSDAGSEDSDSEGEDQDPLHPYNVPDGKQWIRAGNYVYPADDLKASYLTANADHVVDDAPYLPPGGDKVPNSFLSPNDIAPDTPFIQPYVFRDASPMHEQQAVSPLELTSPSRNRTSSSRLASASARKARTYAEEDSDDDAYTSGDDASEDEYVPSPKLRSHKLPSSRASTSGRSKARATPRHSYSPYPSSSASTPGSSSAADSPHASSSRQPGPRNRQIFDQPPPPRGSWSKTGPDAYKCPYCTHIQDNKRSPDMERHIRSHFRSSSTEKWVCCGVPVEEAEEYDVSPDVGRWEFNGHTFVGGCQKDFSRMDALKRHWNNKNITCVGDIQYSRPDCE